MLFLVSVFFLFQKGYSQSDNFPLGARAAALGNAYSSESGLWSVHHNQAGLGFYPHLSMGFHHENKFLVDEFNLHAFALTLPVNSGTFGLSYSYYGYKIYNESKVGLAYGRQFGNGFSAGIQLNLHHNYLEGEFGNRNALSVEGGIQYKPGERVRLGIHLFNPTQSTISYRNDTIPAILTSGVTVLPISRLSWMLQLRKYLNRDIRIESGIEYLLMESLYIRGGIMTEPFQSTFGIGYLINKVSADIAFTRHPVLGFTPHFSLQVKFERYKD